MKACVQFIVTPDWRTTSSHLVFSLARKTGKLAGVPGRSSAPSSAVRTSGSAGAWLIALLRVTIAGGVAAGAA